MGQEQSVIHSDPGILGGATVFVGTRVPVRTLLDYLEAGRPLAEFLDDFPTVTRSHAIAVWNRRRISKNDIEALLSLMPAVRDVLVEAALGRVAEIGGA